jgi:hypothetical protein
MPVAIDFMKLFVIIPFNVPLGGCAWYVFQRYSADGEESNRELPAAGGE